VEASVKKAIALLDPLAANAANTDARGLLGSGLRSLARLHKAQKKFNEAIADYEKAIAQLGDEKNISTRSDTERDFGDLLRDTKDYASAGRHYAAAAKVHDALAEAPPPAAGAFHRASWSWSLLSGVQQTLGDYQAAQASLETSLLRQTRAHELEPDNLDCHSRLIDLLCVHARFLAQFQPGEQAMASVARAARELGTYLSVETNIGRLNQLNESGSYTQTKLRDFMAYPAAEKMLRQVIAIRQRLETLRAWPEDASLSSIAAQLTLAALLHDMKRDPESDATLGEALAAADHSARPAIIAEAHLRARALSDARGKQEEAERHARRAYEITQQVDLGYRALSIAGDFASTLAKRRQFAEAEKVALSAWDLASTRTWPAEPVKLRHDLAEKISNLYRVWDASEPADTRRQSARQWRERQLQALPLEAKLNDYDLSAALLVWTWRMADGIEAGRIEDCQRERTHLLQLLEGRQNAELAQRAARCALLLPAEGAELARAAKLAEFSFKATAPTSGNYDWYVLAQGLALIRQNRGSEARAVLQPALQTTSPDRWFSIRALCALAHQQAGEADKAKAMLNEIEKADARAQGYLKDPVAQDAAVARVLVKEARRALAP
jgi:tetratricopeptide (TPR) repeat protein